MNKCEEVMKRLSGIGIIPVVVIEDSSDAIGLGDALMQGGLHAAEVTFRTAAAEDSIRILKESYPDMLIGAGTILSTEQAEKAVKAGAEFIVSPCFDRDVTGYCIGNNIPVCPGIQTPTELNDALKMGLKYVKFFPAGLSGGIRMINTLGSVFQQVRFMPTGGINAGNAEEYLNSERVFCCGGSWMVKSDLIKNKDFDTIRKLTKEAAEIAASVKGRE